MTFGHRGIPIGVGDIRTAMGNWSSNHPAAKLHDYSKRAAQIARHLEGLSSDERRRVIEIVEQSLIVGIAPQE